MLTNWLKKWGTSAALMVAFGGSLAVAQEPAIEAAPAVEETAPAAEASATIEANVETVVELVGDDVTVTAEPKKTETATIDFTPLSTLWLGVECEPITDVLKAQLKLDRGLVVKQVIPASPAAKANIRQFDVLLRLGDAELGDVDILAKTVEKVGEKDIDVLVLRDGTQQTLKVTPARRAAPKALTIIAAPEARWSAVQRLLARPDAALEENVELLLVRPGVVLTTDLTKQNKLPGDVSININKEGEKPARIEVRRGEKSWRVSEDELDELPEDLRGFVGRALGQDTKSSAPLVVRSLRDRVQVAPQDIPARVTLRQTPAIAKPVPAPQSSLERKLDDVIKKLDQVLNELRRERRDQSRQEPGERPDYDRLQVR